MEFNPVCQAVFLKEDALLSASGIVSGRAPSRKAGTGVAKGNERDRG